jgi:hypothetical protein
VLGEGVLEREGLLVERAGRPAGGIAAVTWLKAYRVTPLVIVVQIPRGDYALDTTENRYSI